MGQPVGGTITLRVGGVRRKAKGEFTYNLGLPKRTPVVGADGVHGYKEEPQAPKISGKITDEGGLSLAEILTLRNTPVSLELANGKVIEGRACYYTGEGDVTTGEGEIAFEISGEAMWEAR